MRDKEAKMGDEEKTLVGDRRLRSEVLSVQSGVSWLATSLAPATRQRTERGLGSFLTAVASVLR